MFCVERHKIHVFLSPLWVFACIICNNTEFFLGDEIQNIEVQCG